MSSQRRNEWQRPDVNASYRRHDTINWDQQNYAASRYDNYSDSDHYQEYHQDYHQNYHQYRNQDYYRDFPKISQYSY